MSEPNIIVLNLGKRIAVLNDGRVAPVTNMLDASGEETENAAECVTFVAKAADDCWLADRADEFEAIGP